MKKTVTYSFCSAVLLIMAMVLNTSAGDMKYDTNPPFRLKLLKPVTLQGPSERKAGLFGPKNPYGIFINY